MISNFENFLLRTEILLKYNYDSRKRKEPLKNFRIIKCLKNGSELTEIEFVIKIKDATQKMHHLQYVKKSAEKRNRLEKIHSSNSNT